MPGDDLEARVSELEQKVEHLSGRVTASEQDAAAARVLAGAADRDVSAIQGELRDFRQATASGFNAMRQDFVDLREDFVDLREDFVDLRQHVDEGFARVDQGFTEMRGKLDATAAGQQRIAELIQTLIDQ
ncbi:hypothetical protein [Mycobacterium kyorinense]|uniref:Uncharacterized protein n=1 Tax=Mycobacterium kyorinense TaxID=487514 RepID=A0A1X1Y808_9MYCO|nr:hypothetical protein [Mycobacterium kyorinense]ORW07208.1 hypothetical protein AWC14_25040 [Mycobacterium kyorinense]